jgi:thymidylate synthase (FAD)
MKVNMKVELGSITQNPVEEIYKAYKLCYSKLGQTEMIIPKTEDGSSDIEKMSNFIKPLMASNHTSPLEHVSFTFYIEDVSRSLTHQLVRHRTGKYNQQSQRYVNLESIFDYITPLEIENEELCNEVFENTMSLIYDNYVVMSDILKDKYITQGRDKRSAEKKAIENYKEDRNKQLAEFDRMMYEESGREK